MIQKGHASGSNPGLSFLLFSDLQNLCMLAGRVLAFGPTVERPYRCAAGFCEQDFAHIGYVDRKSRKRRACEECWYIVFDAVREGRGGYNARI